MTVALTVNPQLASGRGKKVFSTAGFFFFFLQNDFWHILYISILCFLKYPTCTVLFIYVFLYGFGNVSLLFGIPFKHHLCCNSFSYLLCPGPILTYTSSVLSYMSLFHSTCFDIVTCSTCV